MISYLIHGFLTPLDRNRVWKNNFRGPVMAPSDQPNPSGEEEIPLIQKFLDNHFLLLFLGVAIPTVVYIIWGIIEITAIPLAK